MSSGLTYTPGMYADTEELAALCEVVAEFGGFYAPHTRSYGAGALEAYAEMIELARTTGCALHLTHATMNFGVNRGRAPEFLDMVDAGIADGCDITLDTYPYLPGATTLSALLPSWAMSGGPDAALARLRDPAARARITEDVDVNGSDGCHGVTVGVGDHPDQRSGQRRPRRVRREDDRRRSPRTAGRAPVDVFFDLLSRDNLATTILQHVGHEENVRAIMLHPRHMGGSDAMLVGGEPHPRAWGTFPRYLGHYVRELGLLEPRGVRRSPDRPRRHNDCGSLTAAWSAPATPPTWCCSTPPRSPTPRPSRTPNSRRAESATSSSTARCAIDDGAPTGRLAGRALPDGPLQRANPMTTRPDRLAMSTVVADRALAVVRAPESPTRLPSPTPSRSRGYARSSSRSPRSRSILRAIAKPAPIISVPKGLPMTSAVEWLPHDNTRTAGALRARDRHPAVHHHQGQAGAVHRAAPHRPGAGAGRRAAGQGHRRHRDQER